METTNLAPTVFRFYQTEEELVSFYLHNKLEGKREDLNRFMDRVIPVADIYVYNPWDLPQISGEVSYGDTEQWFFFSPRQESEAHGGRPNHLTTTGSPNHVYSSNNCIIGIKNTMVFYIGRALNGTKTEWNIVNVKAEAEGRASSEHFESLQAEVLRLGAEVEGCLEKCREQNKDADHLREEVERYRAFEFEAVRLRGEKDEEIARLRAKLELKERNPSLDISEVKWPGEEEAEEEERLAKMLAEAEAKKEDGFEDEGAADEEVEAVQPDSDDQ
ncbi:putative NAC domain-containing protein [Quillaja saponaria]|uniref:NAC domain-containing protein n=1 Tax=Quillaja saponaria TaxID=32244 RepID=A0AAD7VDF3_QUISA|nr:putative NAC domain-containing protein [Quillaja saponaria]